MRRFPVLCLLFFGAFSLVPGSPILAQQPRAAADTLLESCPAADGTVEDPTYPVRKLAFAADAAGDHAAARHLMRCAIHANAKDVVALRQEVYLDLSAGDPRGASEDIDALRRLGAGTAQFDAQQGYIFYNAKRYSDARVAFGRAIASSEAAGGDAEIREKAMAAIRVMDGEFPRHVFDFGVDAQYLNRFNDGVVDAYARYFERLGRQSPFAVYAGTRLLRDTASQVGPLPQIFSDNALLTGVGVRFHPRAAHYYLDGEANEAYVFYGGRNHRAAFAPDFRGVAGYYRVLRADQDSAVGDRLALELNGSFGFYSRYQHDGIAYLQPRETFDLAREGTLKLTPFFQQSIALDTNRTFYNNTVELIPGFEAKNTRLGGVALRVEYVRGFYLPAGAASANPYGSSYSDFRVRLLFQKSVALGPGGR